MRRFLAASLVVLAFVAAFGQKQTMVVYAYGSE
jgi:hypothetical protein